MDMLHRLTPAARVKAAIQRRLELRVAEWESAKTDEGRRAAEAAIDFLNETLRQMAREGSE